MGRAQEARQHGQMCDAGSRTPRVASRRWVCRCSLYDYFNLSCLKILRYNFEDVKRNDLTLFSWMVQGKYVQNFAGLELLKLFYSLFYSRIAILFYFQTSRLREVGKTAGASQVALVVKNPPANAGDLRDAGSVPGSGIASGGEHGSPLQYSCLENPIDREAWRATVHGVAKSQT